MWSKNWGNLPYFCEHCKKGTDSRKAWEIDPKTQETVKKLRAERSLEILKSSGIAKKFAKLRFANLEETPKLHELIGQYLEDYRARVGRGLFLWGNIGAGKTATASIVGSEVAERYLDNLLMINWADALNTIKESFDTKADHPGKSLLKRMKSIGLLIVDDIHQEKGSDWVREQFFIVINTRYNNGLPTIITSQWPLEDVGQRYGQQIESRLAETCQVIEFTGEDRRKQQRSIF